ncbi:B-cell linker protein isoform X2 [Cololabis saira]|uniref:B-cell linker protein isoform X2 n=1 Tax=Cololabis saira TaxID=129043 RepID=UPI002AD36C78|nr:B-cell linker protein isoform X2 [Cololabis saira]
MNLPSKQECERWDQAQVAGFMVKNNMPECASIIVKLKINGQRLMNLSECDISKFSLIHQPQLQKIVQDIRKNDGSLLDKFRRLKSKPLPNIPARDYGDDDQSSDREYHNEEYEELPEEDNYEPPPSHREFSAPSASLPRGEYLDQRPSRPPKTPLRPGRVSKQLPPEPQTSDEEDYINPDAANDGDYVEPEENPASNPMMHGGSRAARDLDCGPKFYKVPDKEERSLTFPPNRLCPVPAKQTQSLPPRPSPRLNIRRSPLPVQESADNTEYEVADPHDSPRPQPPAGPRPPLPRPLLRESKPSIMPKPEIKPREFESRTLPVMHQDQNSPPRAFTMDFKRPKLPCPQFTPPTAERGGVAAENGSMSQEKDRDMSNKPWFAGACDRRTADEALLRSNKDGAFLVRRSSGQDALQPFTLVVFYRGRVYNIPIRVVAGSGQFALGRQKHGEEHFSSISHIVENHQRNPLVLIDAQSNSKDSTKLCHAVKP